MKQNKEPTDKIKFPEVPSFPVIRKYIKEAEYRKTKE